MLCDQIIAFPLERDLAPEVARVYHALGVKLQKAQRFVLNRDAVMTVHSISESSPKRFLQALQVCRLPFPSIWVEFAYKDRDDWMAEARQRGMDVETHTEASAPSRLGFYMEQADKSGRIIDVIPGWSHPSHGTVSICHLALSINTENGEFRVDEEHAANMRAQLAAKTNKKVFHKWMNDEDEIEAGFSLEARIRETVPKVFEAVWSRIMLTCSKEHVAHLYELARFDLKAEWRFTLALLTVLNSRNVVEIGSESDFTRLNKARAKKGAPPLMTHREIKLNMSKVQKHRLGNAYGHRDLQAHLVRGHWKLRSSGLYWWNPHVRGIGEAPMTTTIVKG